MSLDFDGLGGQRVAVSHRVAAFAEGRPARVIYEEYPDGSRRSK